MTVRLLATAEAELQEAREWYEAQAPGLGRRLLAEVKEARGRIELYPRAWTDLGDGVRRCRLKRFPYGLIYIELDKEIVVLAVAHNHRKPDYWRHRLFTARRSEGETES